MPAFRCPHCSQPLIEAERDFRCAAGHHFDRAREGYVNLLPGGRIKGRPAGDDEQMVRSRRAVFDRGLYRPAQQAVGAAAGPAVEILDAGCGEGTYLAAATQATGAAGWGVDVSKPAVRAAARRHREHRYAVASTHVLPFDDEVFDTVLNVFAPRDFAEMRRVLRPGGRAVVVTPGTGHLQELKTLLYDEARSHRPSDEAPHDGWAMEGEQRVQFLVALPEPTVRLALLQMTPYWWGASEQRRADVQARAAQVTVDMVLAVWRKSQ